MIGAGIAAAGAVPSSRRSISARRDRPSSGPAPHSTRTSRGSSPVPDARASLPAVLDDHPHILSRECWLRHRHPLALPFCSECTDRVADCYPQFAGFMRIPKYGWMASGLSVYRHDSGIGSTHLDWQGCQGYRPEGASSGFSLPSQPPTGPAPHGAGSQDLPRFHLQRSPHLPARHDSFFSSIA